MSVLFYICNDFEILRNFWGKNPLDKEIVNCHDSLIFFLGFEFYKDIIDNYICYPEFSLGYLVNMWW